MGSTARRALLLGWRGGVGTAVTNLLADHPAGRRLADGIDALFLLDREDAPPPPIPGVRVLPACSVDTPAELEALIEAHGIDQVIEVADVDTLGFAAACGRRGADYLSTSLQRRDLDDPDAEEGLTMVAAGRLAPDRRPAIDGGSHLIGSGMNPGVVNALVLAGLDELARRAGTRADVEALDVYAIHVTEQDTTRRAAPSPPDGAFEMSWSPRHCLDEVLEPDAMAMAGGRLIRLGHRPHARWYAARCGAADVAGMIVPHEEIVTIGHRFPSVESAFFYAVPAAARRALARAPERPPEAWRTRKLYPPHEDRLLGRDRVGALVCSRRHGELWVGFDTPVEAGLRHGTNATQLQVGAGVLAGWGLLGAVPGVHVVEELDWRAYLAPVEEVLGVRQVHHVPDAPVRTLRDRRLRGEPAAERDPARRLTV